MSFEYIFRSVLEVDYYKLSFKIPYMYNEISRKVAKFLNNNTAKLKNRNIIK